VPLSILVGIPDLGRLGNEMRLPKKSLLLLKKGDSEGIIELKSLLISL
jgi:hypothetical protein